MIWPGRGLNTLRLRADFVARALRIRREVQPFIHPGSDAFGRFVRQRPEAVGAVIWPYINHGWDAPTRLRRIQDHYAATAAALPMMDFAIDESRTLVDLSDLSPGLHVVLDQAKWFIREGQLVINLFTGDVRIFSLAFSFRLEPELTAYIGAIQGRNLDSVLDTYRDLTKVLHGMRPRDFVVETFISLCRVAGVARVVAVSDAFRQHRSPYFGSCQKTLALNYDEIWQERGGEPLSPEFYSLPIEGTRRDMADVPSKKRSMYRKRYELLDRIENSLKKSLQTCCDAKDGSTTTDGREEGRSPRQSGEARPMDAVAAADAPSIPRGLAEA